jgi:hypothetical protein
MLLRHERAEEHEYADDVQEDRPGTYWAETDHPLGRLESCAVAPAANAMTSQGTAHGRFARASRSHSGR